VRAASDCKTLYGNVICFKIKFAGASKNNWIVGVLAIRTKVTSPPRADRASISSVSILGCVLQPRVSRDKGGRVKRLQRPSDGEKKLISKREVRMRRDKTYTSVTEMGHL